MNKNTMEKKNQAAAAATQAALQKEAALTAEALLQQLGSSAQGLTADQVEKNRETYGENKVTQEKKKSVGVRLAEAFINPFTVILFVLAGVSAVTDIILPLMQNRLDDYNPATVIIITVLVLLSGSLRFIQETPQGDARQAPGTDYHHLHGHPPAGGPDGNPPGRRGGRGPVFCPPGTWFLRT